jgi:predicted AAA+ superfamily ATPase
MQALLEQIIADLHERNLPDFTARHAVLPMLPNKIDTVIGMRRSGKTWYLYQVISNLLKKGIAKEGILYVNLEDERLHPMTASVLHWIPETYYRRYPHLKKRPSLPKPAGFAWFPHGCGRPPILK